MTYQVTIPVGGYAGWKFLERTMDVQEDVLAKSPAMSREVEYFNKNIGKVTSAKALVEDHTLLKVALGAYGLGEDLPNKAFILKVLEEGSRDETAFANRLTDKRYLAFTKAFGFENTVPNTKNQDFSKSIIDAFRRNEFEVSVGTQDEDLRMGLTVDRELAEIANGEQSPNAKWFLVMGNPPLREVFETAFNLPQSFGALDLDRQLEVLKEKSARVFDTPEVSSFATKENRENLIKRFMINAQVQRASEAFNSQSAALTLLQSNRFSYPSLY